MVRSGEDSSWFVDSCFLVAFSHGESRDRGRKFSHNSYKDTIPFMREPPSWPYYFPEAPSLNTVTWGVGFQHMNFRRTQHSVHSMIISILELRRKNKAYMRLSGRNEDGRQTSGQGLGNVQRGRNMIEQMWTGMLWVEAVNLTMLWRPTVVPGGCELCSWKGTGALKGGTWVGSHQQCGQDEIKGTGSRGLEPESGGGGT